MNTFEMRLFYSTRSPFVRKVRVVIREKGLLPRTEERLTDTMANDAEFLGVNPLGKVPALLTPIGPLFDSPVMCEYLDQLSSTTQLLPIQPAQRLAVLRFQALADGVLDAAVSIALERRRPQEQQSPLWLQRWHSAIERSFESLSKQTLPTDFDLGAISTVCALDYVSFRCPEIEWVRQWPGLKAWSDPFLSRPSMRDTTPFIS